jgi:prepilin-type N-terminal cleavage/methylation domain-containing protein
MMEASRTQSSESGPKGFSLFEVLIALFIAAVGLLSLSSMQFNAIKGNGASNELTYALYLAQSVVEQIADGNLDDAEVFGFMESSDAAPGVLLANGTMTAIDVQGEDGGPFDLQWQVFAHTPWSRKISVMVSWRSIMGLTRSVSVTTISRGEDNR